MRPSRSRQSSLGKWVQMTWILIRNEEKARQDAYAILLHRKILDVQVSAVPSMIRIDQNGQKSPKYQNHRTGFNGQNHHNYQN